MSAVAAASLLLQYSRTIRGVTVGLERPLVLAVLPVVVVALAWLVARGEGTASLRSRRLLFASRTLVVLLLVVGAAGPYTVTTAETPGDPRVTLLVDQSDSMAVTEDVGDLAGRIEDENVPVRRVVIANGTDSSLGDAISANLRDNGTVVVVSDGQVTSGGSLANTIELANSLNATVGRVELEETTTERAVSIAGPSKTSVGIENTFLVSVDGVELSGETTTVTVTVDGQEVASRDVEGGGSFEVSRSFPETGSHRVVAELGGSDGFGENDVARKSVRVVERPRVLYVAEQNYPLRTYLSQLYRVERRESVPSNLTDYYAVVVQNKRAGTVGDVEALQEFVIDGGGLVVAGGSQAFDGGGYSDSAFGSMLPVRVGNRSGQSANIVLAIDISGSSERGMRVQKAIALSALSQLGDDNVVGLVAFNNEVYDVVDPVLLSQGRGDLEDAVRRLSSTGGTNIGAALLGAHEQMGGGSGTIILISDGRDNVGGALSAARQVGENARIITIATGPDPDTGTLRRISDASGGTYLRADETNRLAIRFGGDTAQFSGKSLTILDRSSFVTAGVTLEAQPPLSNGVSVKPGADFLVASSDGRPALATWRYGLGRVATLTVHDRTDTLGGLLREPDSLLVTKTTNWAIGDPERKREGVADAADTRVGEATTVRYRGASRPRNTSVEFRQAGEGRYRATVTPDRPGFQSVLDAEFAVNYHREYAAFGLDSGLQRLVDATGGEVFEPSQAAEIATFARESASRVREVRRSWAWLALAAGLLLFGIEVAVRRLQVYRGRAANESGLT